jgi:hypothetical protein
MKFTEMEGSSLHAEGMMLPGNFASKSTGALLIRDNVAM